MSETWLVDLPFVKPLSMNDRLHHMVKAKLVAQWRKAAREAFTDIPPCKRVKVTLFYFPAQNRRRDPDNLVASMKPVVDALADMGIVPDDTQEFVERVWPVIMPPEPKRTVSRFQFQIEKLA
jgi:crossover junction endodeoxyribonuclease RusA